MRYSFAVLAVASTALAQGGMVSQISDGQIQAPTGYGSPAPAETTSMAETSAAPVETTAATVETSAAPVTPTPYSSWVTVSAPPELSSAYTSVPSVTPVPLPSPISVSTPSAAPPAPSYPAGNGTVPGVAPSGTGAMTSTMITSAGESTGSATSAGAVGGSATTSSGSAEQTGNGAGVVSVQTGVFGVVFAGLVALLA